MSVNNSDLICLIMFWVITLKWAYDIGHKNSYHEEALKRIDEIGNKSNESR